MNNAHFYLDIIENRLFYDPNLTHKGGSGGKSDRLSRLFTYDFLIKGETIAFLKPPGTKLSHDYSGVSGHYT